MNAWKQSGEARAEVADLWGRLAWALEVIMFQLGYRDCAGWIGTMGRLEVQIAGDQLVEMGLWERREGPRDGTWFYRRLLQVTEPDGEVGSWT